MMLNFCRVVIKKYDFKVWLKYGKARETSSLKVPHYYESVSNSLLSSQNLKQYFHFVI